MFTFIPGVPLWVGILLIVVGGVGCLAASGYRRGLALAALGIGIFACIHSPAPNAPSKQFDLSATAFRGAQRGPQIEWHFPPDGGEEMFLGASYYVELNVQNTSGQDRNRAFSPDVYFVGPDGQTLHIILLEISGSNHTPAGEKRLFRFDTDGYTGMLQGTSEKDAARFFVLIDKHVFSGTLPAASKLKDKAPTPIVLNEGTLIPDVGAVPPVQVASILAPSGGAPALIRQQDNQTSIYFYHAGVPLVLIEQQRPSSTGDLWLDMAKIGIRQDAPTKTVIQTPWPETK
jgi:hypothetical protein